MIMPLWMERLKLDKSRTVREACALYLGQALMSWTGEGYDGRNMDAGWHRLDPHLRDPLPDVAPTPRRRSKKCRNAHPTHWDSLVNDPDGRRQRCQSTKVAQNIRTGRADQDELSVNSKFLQLGQPYAGTTNESRPTQQLPIPLISMPPSTASAGSAAAGYMSMSTDRGGFSVPSIAVTKDSQVSSRLLLLLLREQTEYPPCNL
jgi:hypothetical protein